jgi:hypothetical protein
MGFIRAGGFNMFVLVALGLFAIPTAVGFARNADPHRLSLLRALTRALVFSAVIGFVSGLAVTALRVAHDPEAMKQALAILLVGFAESCANLILGGGIAAIVWILIAVGVRRMPHDPL